MTRYRLYVGSASLYSYAEKMRDAGISNVVASAGFVDFDSEHGAFGLIPFMYERVGYLPTLRELRSIA